MGSSPLAPTTFPKLAPYDPAMTSFSFPSTYLGAEVLNDTSYADLEQKGVDKMVGVDVEGRSSCAKRLKIEVCGICGREPVLESSPNGVGATPSPAPHSMPDRQR